MTMPFSSYPYELPPLPYAYDALEPYIDAETMHYHYDKHFAAYIDKLNAAVEPYPHLHALSVDELLARPSYLPRAARESILQNAGGVYNHGRFFNGLAPASDMGHQPQGDLAEMIDRDFGDADAFYAAFKNSAMSVFGSGWTYLVQDRSGRLRMVNLANQDTLVQQGLEPIILADVWEHAYYLKYKNQRGEYLDNLRRVLLYPDLRL